MFKPKFRLMKYLLISTLVFFSVVFLILAMARVDESVEVWGEVSLKNYDRVYSPALGFIDSVCVEQGQLVKRNQLLILIKVEGESKKAEILSPTDGLIYSSSLDELRGRHVGKGEVLMVVSDPYQMGFRALVPEKSIPFIEKGLQATLFIDAFPYQRFGTFQGVVISISPMPELKEEKIFYPATLLVRPPYVESEFLKGEPGLLLKPGMRGKARIITRSNASILNRLIERFLS
jgi:multidrug efflux pump subunit AcrA (membrane-fusion protein)